MMTSEKSKRSEFSLLFFFLKKKKKKNLIAVDLKGNYVTLSCICHENSLKLISTQRTNQRLGGRGKVRRLRLKFPLRWNYNANSLPFPVSRTDIVFMTIFFIVDYSKIIIIIIAFCPLIKNYPYVLQDEKNQVMQVNLWIRQVISFRDVFQVNS